MLINLVILNNPFNLQEREIKRLNVSSDEIPLQDFLEKYVPIDSEMEYHASINGRVFTPEEIPLQTVRQYDSVVVCPVISGGGGRGSNPLSILAGLALAVFSFGVVSPFVSGLFGGGMVGSIAGSIAAGLTLMVGGQLIGNAFSPSLASENKEINSTSYGWGSLQNITQQGGIIPITYGTVRVAGQILDQRVDYQENGEEEILYALLSGGEGAIDGISDIRINDNPIENYDDAVYNTRLGENTQTVIPGFGVTSSSQAVNVTLENGKIGGEIDRNTPGEWHIVEFAGDVPEALIMTFNFPRGLCFYASDSPEPKGNWVEWEVEISFKNNGVWGAWSYTGLNRKESSSTTPFTVVGQYSLTSEAWNYYEAVRVRARVTRKDLHENKNNQCMDTIVWQTLTGLTSSDLTHPNKVLVGLRVKATNQLNGGMPTITWKQTRNKVLVYQGGEWVEKNAQNPAWIIYDLCVHARNLDGVVHVFGEDPARMDFAAFNAWAEWNDRTLNNRPAIRMNLLVDESKSLFEWCNDIAASARGAVVLKGTKISCIFDRPSDPVQLFTVGNIIAGSFSGEFLSVEERANAVEIAYNNEANNFEREQITVYSETYNDSDSRANPVSVQLTGITDFERAYREGIYRLNQNKYILRTISFTADVDAIACQVGDVILVQHDIPQWGQGGRIMAVSGSELTLDNEITFNPEKAYVIIIRKQNDERIQRYVSGTGTTDTVTITGGGDLSGVAAYDIFTIGQLDKAAKPFRVQEMSRTGDLQITLTCTEYIAEIYTEADNIPVIDYVERNNAISGLEIVSTGYYTASGEWIAEIWAFWNYIGERPASYDVQWRYDGGIWQSLRSVSDTRAQSETKNSNTKYEVRVRAQYVSGLPCEWSYAAKTGLSIVPSIPPNAPENLIVQGWWGYAELTWTNPPNPDFDHTEIWEADEDDLTKAVHIGNTYANNYTRLLQSGGNFWYWVRAVNKTGLKSAFNTLAGTPCTIITNFDSETYQSFISQFLEDNPYLTDSLESLNERITPLENSILGIQGDIQDISATLTPVETLLRQIDNVVIPDLNGKVADNQDNIQNILFPVLDRVGEGILRLDSETARTRNVFRWAGIEVNEDEGTVVIRGIEDLKTETGYQFTDVTQRLDAQQADINLKASRTYVDQIAASIISGMVVAQEWKFSNTLNGWTGQNATLTAQSDGIKYTITAANPSMTSPNISINGAVNNLISIQLQQSSGTESYSIRIQYKTASHGYSDSYMKRVEVLGSLNIVRSIQVDMHTLTAGGTDWQNSTITGIRILITDTINSVYILPLINVGQSSTTEIGIQDLTIRITQAEADIDGANAAIALKADESTVSELGQRLNQAELKIDALSSSITLKADRTELNDTNSRLHTAEVRLDAIGGAISQEIAQYNFSQSELQNNAEAALQNAVNESTGQDERRAAVAQAKQELHAEITETNEAISEYRLELLTAINGNRAAIQDEAIARSNADQAEAQARQILATKVNENAAAIQVESTTRATQDNALSQRVTTLQSTVSGNTALIQTNAAAISSINGELAAKYTIKTDVNGYVAGYELYNGGSGKTSFTLAADKFLIAPPGTTSPKQMFVYDSTSGKFAVPYILVKDANIENASITGAKIKNATIEMANIKAGSVTTPYMASDYNSHSYTKSGGGSFNLLQCNVKTVANTPINIIYGLSYVYKGVTGSNYANGYYIDYGGTIKSLSSQIVTTEWLACDIISPIQSGVVHSGAILYGGKDEAHQIVDTFIWTPTQSATTSIQIQLNDFDWGYRGTIEISNQFIVALALYR